MQTCLEKYTDGSFVLASYVYDAWLDTERAMTSLASDPDTFSDEIDLLKQAENLIRQAHQQSRQKLIDTYNVDPEDMIELPKQVVFAIREEVAA